MLRIRFHGRGGHGVKTASRIVGSAAYRAGFFAQDSPIYGAERRGAPIAAFTRISEDPILERGIIEAPDLIVVADETLLSDPLAGVLAGEETASAIFVNTDSAQRITQSAGISLSLFTYDVTARTAQEFGRASAMSAGLAGAAARLSGLIDEDYLLAAVREELDALGFSPELIEKNAAVAGDVYAALPEVELEQHEAVVAGEVIRMQYDDPVHGAPEILNTGNAILKKTGNWCVEEPIIDLETCTRCGLCVVLCPDGAIALDKDAFPVIDYDHCKGCMICREICPPKAISVGKEVRAS